MDLKTSSEVKVKLQKAKQKAKVTVKRRVLLILFDSEDKWYSKETSRKNHMQAKQITTEVIGNH